MLPNWSAYSGTLSQIVAMKVRYAAPATAAKVGSGERGRAAAYCCLIGTVSL